MADLNPNRSNVNVDLEDDGGDLNLVQNGEVASRINVTQHGNVIMYEFRDMLTPLLTGTSDNAVMKTAPGTTTLESRMVPQNEPIVPVSVHLIAVPDVTNTAQAGGASTITLNAADPAVGNAYAGYTIKIVSGTGAGQTRDVSGNIALTKVATVSVPWATIPNATSVYELYQPGNIDKWVVTTMTLSNPSTSAIGLTLTPPNGAWPAPPQGSSLPRLDINLSQVKYMAQAQANRDYRV